MAWAYPEQQILKNPESKTSGSLHQAGSPVKESILFIKELNYMVIS